MDSHPSSYQTDWVPPVLQLISGAQRAFYIRICLLIDMILFLLILFIGAFSMQLKKPDPRILTVWRLRLLPAAALFFFLSIRFVAVHEPVWWLFTGCWITICMILLCFYFPLKYRYLSYAVKHRVFLLHWGVLYTRIRAVPFHAVQYAAILSTPLERRFSICSLKLYMAGSHISVPGLHNEDAKELRDILSPKKPERENPHE